MGKSIRLIGVVAHDWFRTVPLRMLSWISQTADTQKYRVISSQSNAKPEALAEFVHECGCRGVDGVVYLAWEDDPMWNDAAKLFQSIHCVVSVWGDPGIPHGRVVQSDFAGGTALGVQHLYARGRRRIVQVLEDVALDFNRQRRAGVVTGYEACGLPFSEDAICVATKGWDVDDPRFDDLIEELVVRRKADAILGDNDEGTISLMNALRRRGMSPGEDVAFVGWGNDRHCMLSIPTLTTVCLHLDVVCAHALRLASAQQPGVGPHRVMVPASIVVRQSS